MSRRRTRAAAGAAALVALGAAVGVGAYVVARDDRSSTTPTRTTATTSTSLSISALQDAVAEALLAGLPVVVTAEEAACLAIGMVAAVPPEQLRGLEPADPLAGVSDEQRAAILRATIGCLPAASASALLGDPTTTSVSLDLPDEGG